MASIEIPVVVNLPDNWADMVAERLIKEGDCVIVVRCKDCKHAIRNLNHPDKPLICCLTRQVGETDEDWFCADGERKEAQDG